MFRALLRLALIAAPMVVVFIVATAGPMLAKPPKGADLSNSCNRAYWNCIDRCKGGPFAPGRNVAQCQNKCDVKQMRCAEKKATNKERVNTPTNKPPNSQVNTTGVMNPQKDPTSTTKPPNSKVNTAGVLNPVNAGGVKQLGGSSGSPSTSGGGTTMQRSGRSKK
jgi:hypothetical protein